MKQRALRALMHPLHAPKPIESATETNHRAQKTRRRPGIAHEQFQGLRSRSAFWNFPAQPADANGSIRTLLGILLNTKFESKPPQAIDHHLRVFAPQRARQRD